MGKLGLDMYLFFIRCEKTCDLPVTREKTVAETSFLCGFRGKGESSNPLTHVIKKWDRTYRLVPFFIRVQSDSNGFDLHFISSPFHSGRFKANIHRML